MWSGWRIHAGFSDLTLSLMAMLKVVRTLLFAVIAVAWVAQADAGPRDRFERVRDAIHERQRDDVGNDARRDRGRFNRRDHDNVRDDNQNDDNDLRDRGHGPISYDRDRNFDRDRGLDPDRARQGVAAGRLLPL